MNIVIDGIVAWRKKLTLEADEPIRVRLIDYHEERAATYAAMIHDQAVFEQQQAKCYGEEFSINDFICRVATVDVADRSITAEMRDRYLFHREAADYLKDIAGD